jgi:hypothetical protein
MRALDVFALAAAVIIALLSLVVEPWSKLWWGVLILAAVIVSASALRIFFTATTPWRLLLSTRPRAAIVFVSLVVAFCVGSLGYFWFKEGSSVPPNVLSEFERTKTPQLGKAVGPVEVTTGVYQASHEHAMVVSLLPVQTVFAFPKDGSRPAIAYHFATISDERKWWEDEFLTTHFKSPKDKKPPEYRVAELWDQKPEQLKWVGWREWSCPFRLEKFYYQQFENGIVFGVLPTSETLGSSQIITLLNGGNWSAIEPLDSGVSAPACNERTARVNGVVIHGHHVKPLPLPDE